MTTNSIQVTEPNIKKRSDYLPSAFLIEHVSLTFDLTSESSTVRCVSRVIRNGQHQLPLVLDGEELELKSIAVNGQAWTDYQVEASSMTLNIALAEFELDITTTVYPHLNTSLEGLYFAAGAYCTQCEAEGFRKITYFLDRPDVLATYDVTIRAEQAAFPFLLSNGNKIDSGSLDDGRHWVSWSDPFKKPCYLFALVAGDFDLLVDSYTTMTGREVALELFVDKGKLSKGQHALDSLKKAMQWDEEVFGLEYDLDIYMIVAVDFFNMGAMENKGLNVFNSKFVLADPESATDDDFFNIEAVIAHEYFHNWTGNRVTCRDWFQLSLKEGLTVFRDQQFSADMASPLVNRIKNVKVIRENQFAEDASAMSHPIRPDEVIEMNNFYTVTVYDKGAEVIRMMHTLLGAQGFRQGMDLYFERFDGQAVTCDDFVQALQDATGKDLTIFKRWYSQSGTPSVNVTDFYDRQTGTYRLNISQNTKATAGQKDKMSLHIPLTFSLLDKQGKTLSLDDKGSTELVAELKEDNQQFNFFGYTEKPTPSLLHNFSAPVRLEFDYSNEQLAHVLLHSPDDFARWDASQKIYSDCIHQLSNNDQVVANTLVDNLLLALKPIAENPDLPLAFKAEMLSLPSFETLLQQRGKVNIDKLYNARKSLMLIMAKAFLPQWRAMYQTTTRQPYQYEQGQVEQRKLNNLSLEYLQLSGEQDAEGLIRQQFAESNNMTDTLGALAAAQLGELSLFDDLMSQFEQRWQAEPLVLDKWFSLHANTPRPDILARLEILAGHAQYSISNPNRVRSLVGSFAYYNVPGFHAIDGSGYAFLADYLIKLNTVNPQIAARLITPLTQWQKVDKKRQALMQHQLMRISGIPNLSKDLFEKISKSSNFK
ncbi:aminopeptidase N [Paraglaciecola sp. 25GB23A]|uniref:aminopeptidase N n=1 Tax=Paraglaciecola sp. 25GB23A TaxID=3156068 RepID=UPI0032AEBAF4